MANDTTDPDVISTENIGFSRRQDMYCRTGPEEGPPILATVSGPLINTISAIDKPIPSGLEINIKLVRNEKQFIREQRNCASFILLLVSKPEKVTR